MVAFLLGVVRSDGTFVIGLGFASASFGFNIIRNTIFYDIIIVGVVNVTFNYIISYFLP